MIEDFGNKIASDIWTSDFSNKLPDEFHERAKALLSIMHGTSSLEELQVRGSPPAVRLHKLRGKFQGRWAIDITKISAWRITFEFEGGKFFDVKIEDYH